MKKEYPETLFDEEGDFLEEQELDEEDKALLDLIYDRFDIFQKMN